MIPEDIDKLIRKVEKLQKIICCQTAPSSVNLAAAVVPDTTQTNTIQYNDDGDVWYVDGDGNAISLSGSAVSSVFGRTGAVVAASNDYTFAQLASKPTTVAGYGITDFNSLGDARWSVLAHTHTFASLTSKPTSVSGYGITDAHTDLSLLALQALGSTIKAQPVGLTIANISTNFQIADGTLYLIAVYLPIAATITGVKWHQNLAGSYTSDNYNGVGLYTYSAGTLTLVASSTDDGNIWKATANTFNSKDFSSTYPATAGIYFIGVVWNASVTVIAPAFSQAATGATPGATIMSVDLTNSAKLFSSIATQNTLPSPQALSGATLLVSRPYFALY